jgi:hypothetical protein
MVAAMSHDDTVTLRNDAPRARRVRIDYVVQRLCVTLRTVQDMAARGAIPGAARIGKFWTFDRSKFERFVAAREADCARKTFTNAREYGGCAPPSTALSVEKAYAQAMSRALAGTATEGSKKSKAPSTTGTARSLGKRRSRNGSTTK